MENGIHMKKQLPPSNKLSYSIASRAEEEMMMAGTVHIQCPKCSEHPVVVRSTHRVTVRCPCGFVRKDELLEI